MLRNVLLLCSLSSLTASQSVFPPFTAVRTRNGTLQGRRVTASDGFTCDVFLGIPYALPPTGALRFKEARSASAWGGVLAATNYAPSCPQPVGPRHFLSRSAPLSEDCLTLNVFAPPLRREARTHPVLFWVHGGGFFYGTSATLQPKDICSALVSKGIIVVTLNYRLGPLGFLDPQDGSSPGNLGIRDQIKALEWVQENILAFGGNPNRVSAGGHGSGAAILSAISLTRSDLMESLLLMSGSILAPWAVTNHSRESTQLLARNLQCPPRLKTSACLQRIPWRNLISSSPELWSPFIDGNEGIIRGKPRAILSASAEPNIPILAGVNGDEAAFLVIQKLLRSGNTLSKELFTAMLVPEFSSDFLHSNRKPLLDALKLQYFSLQPGGSLFDYLDSAIQLYTDFLYRSPMLLEASLRARRSKAYVYSYENPSGVELANSPGWRGAPHGLDLLDLWGPDSAKAQHGSFLITRPLTPVLPPLFAAFINNRTGLVNSEGKFGWRSFSESSPNILRIGNTIRLEAENLERRMHFWSEFIPGLLETLGALRNPFTLPTAGTRIKDTSDLKDIQGPLSTNPSSATSHSTSTVTYVGDVPTKIPDIANLTVGDDPPSESNRLENTVSPYRNSGIKKNSTVIIRAGPIPENRTVLWIMVTLALIFFMMFLVTAGGCAAWHRQSYQMPPSINPKSRHQNAEIRIPRIPERPPVHQNGHPRISVPRIPDGPPPPLPTSIYTQSPRR